MNHQLAHWLRQWLWCRCGVPGWDPMPRRLEQARPKAENAYTGLCATSMAHLGATATVHSETWFKSHLAWSDNSVWIRKIKIHLCQYSASMSSTTKEQVEQLETMDPSPATYAAIMATSKPDVRGKGYIKLYLLSMVVFLCSTMNGKLFSYFRSDNSQVFFLSNCFDLL